MVSTRAMTMTMTRAMTTLLTAMMVLSATLMRAHGTTTTTTGRKVLSLASPSPSPSSSYGARRRERGDVDITSVRMMSMSSSNQQRRLSRYGFDGGGSTKGYASVGIIPRRGAGAEALDGMDLERDDNVLRAAYERSYKGELILINANAGGATMARNAAASARAVGIEHFLLYTESEDTCLRIMAMSAKTHDGDIDCAWTSYLKGHPRLKTFGVEREDGADAFRLWWSRFYYMFKLSGVGYNVMYIDTDVSFRFNPYPVFKRADAPLKSYTLFAQAEGRTIDQLNVGFVYIQNAKPDGVARGILNETITRMLAVLESNPPLKDWRGEVAAGAKESLWDQHIFNDVVLSAVVGRAVNPRQGQRVVEPSQRQAWVASHVPKFPSEAEKRWIVERKEVDERLLPPGARKSSTVTEVYYRELAGLKGWTSYDDEYVAAPPFWVIDGWTGAGWSPKTQGANNAWVSEDDMPVVMTHFVGGTDKPLEMKALGWWDYRVEDDDTTNTNTNNNAFIAVKGLKIDAATSAEALYKIKLQTYRLIKLGLSLNRRVIAPAVSCDEPYIERKSDAKFGVWSQNNFVLSTKCGINASRTCCLPKRMSCPGVTLGWIDFFNDVRYATLRHEDTQTHISIDAILERNTDNDDNDDPQERVAFIDVDRLKTIVDKDSSAGASNAAAAAVHDVLIIELASNDGEIPDVRPNALPSHVLAAAVDQCPRGFFYKESAPDAVYPW